MEVPPPQWTRDTTWRQGQVLPAEAVHALGLLHPTVPEATCVVVVSHDCDLANDALTVEPDVEVIVGCHPAKPDGNFHWAKAPRTLHLEFTKTGAPTLVELVATSKRAIPKTALTAFNQDASYSLSGQGLAVLRSWLAVRYNRAAFPDPFVKRMGKVGKALAKLVEPQGALVSAIFFDVDGGKELDRSDSSPYELGVILAYAPGANPDKAADAAEALETAVEKLFAEKHFDKATGKWKDIALKSCLSISEDDLPVSKAKLLMQWRLEYMTLRAEETQPAPPA